ncbi:LysR family transcriptional regulator [Actinacidiphila acididurans]|uniref:LysR family transcriptional regulator n=1 Tax=Actinacidiphila acididurans TaxID=2784346 RepID=A0ABS2TJZ7_9ACTN|nr:LysR family transcriptional regulator [Actinacidiphila acididurans]MBM9503665.1 LysR family transcriptional regulator [Actinacidiphila acididurans]
MGELDLRKLRVLRELSERGTVGAAAQALHLTPQAVSQQISALGKELGVQLTEPAGRRLRLTAAARIVLRHTDAVFSQVEQMHAALAAYQSGEAGQVAVAGFSTTLSALILPAVARLRKDRPGLRTVLAEADPPESFAMLHRGDTDVVISADTMREAGAEASRYHRVTLCEDPFDVALPAGHRLADRGDLRLSDLAGETWIFATTGLCHDIGVAACAAAGFTPLASHAIGDWDATLAAVRFGLGVSLVPRLAKPAPRPDVTIRAFSGAAPSRFVFAAVREGSQESPEIAAVLDALREVATGAVADTGAGPGVPDTVTSAR